MKLSFATISIRLLCESPTMESCYALISTKRYTDPTPPDLLQVTGIHVFAVIFIKLLSNFDYNILDRYRGLIS